MHVTLLPLMVKIAFGVTEDLIIGDLDLALCSTYRHNVLCLCFICRWKTTDSKERANTSSCFSLHCMNQLELVIRHNSLLFVMMSMADRLSPGGDFGGNLSPSYSPGRDPPPDRVSPGIVATSYGCRCLHCFKRDAALKRTLEEDSGDLPPKYKYRHLTTSPPNNDAYNTENGDQNHNRRCTGTQTSFSSFPHDMYPTNQRADYKILDLDSRLSSRAAAGDHVPARHLHIPAMMPSRASPYSTARRSPHSNRSTPPQEDTTPAPLNLTTSQQQQQQQHDRSTSPPHQQHRPSVITLAPFSATQQQPRVGSSGHGSPPRRGSPSQPHSPGQQQPHSPSHSAKITPDTDVRLFIVPNEPCGTSIDEHFRRSLGQNYPAVYGAAPSSPHAAAASPARSRTPPSPLPAPPVYQHPDMPPAEKPKSNVSVAGTVDDHFAKSLGDKWKEINPPKEQPVQLDILAGSVDDHFAKALGETWLKIKAEKERPEGRSNPASPASSTN